MRKDLCRLAGLCPSLVALAGLGCGPTVQPRPEVESFTVGLTSISLFDETSGWQPFWPDPESPEAPAGELPFAARVKVGITIETSPSEPDFDGFVSVAAIPGQILSVESATAEVRRTSVRVVGAAPVALDVQLHNAYGETRLWAEDVGLDPAPPVDSPCDDGIDNDRDGLTDYPLDPGCFMRNDGSERPGSHSVGVSEPIRFANPRLSDSQGCGPLPLLQQQVVTVDRGEMYVTAVTADGFYVSDFSYIRGGCEPGSPCCVGGRYAHMFAYNFNTPYGMRVCDRLAAVSGTVADFYGFTEMNFPSWVMYDVDEDPSNGTTLMRYSINEERYSCPIEAHPLTDAELLSGPEMESWESGFVELVDVELPADADWVFCDLNGDGDVAYRADMDTCVPRSQVRLVEPYCTTQDRCCELECNNACNSRLCAELATFRRYGQFPLQVGTARILATADSVPELDPRELARSGRTHIDRMSGVLRQFAPLDFPWIMQPRCRQDVYIAGVEGFDVDVEVNRRCVPSEETGDYEDPY